VTASDDDRIAYLAGDPADSLSAGDRTQLDELKDMLRSPATWVEPNAALEDRVVDAIAEEVRTAGPAPTGVAAGEPAPARRPVSKPRWWQRRPVIAFGGLAGAVAAAAIVVLIATSGGTSSGQRFAMVVSGTALDPNAHGSATLTKTGSGWRIQLSAAGLPHLVGGHYYQGWLKNGAGILVPVGTFNDARRVTLWSGVPVTQFRTLTVTRQQANGNPASSGKRVLVGTIRLRA
jgi:Anti-sigma-K factor rskA